jgi:hypothetical protein
MASSIPPNTAITTKPILLGGDLKPTNGVDVYLKKQNKPKVEKRGTKREQLLQTAA